MGGQGCQVRTEARTHLRDDPPDGPGAPLPALLVAHPPARAADGVAGVGDGVSGRGRGEGRVRIGGEKNPTNIASVHLVTGCRAGVPNSDEKKKEPLEQPKFRPPPSLVVATQPMLVPPEPRQGPRH